MLEGRALGGGFADVGAEVFDERFDGLLLGVLAGLDEELVNLRADVGRGGFPLGELGSVFRALGRRGEDEVFAREERGEEGLEAVVILLEERVELVVVATRALEADAEERVGARVRDVFENALPLAAHVAVVPLVNAGAEVAGGDEVFWVLGFGFGAEVEFVTGELLAHELVVGLVGVEGLHHVIAVAPGLRAVFVGAIAVGLGVADEVEPVARPLLAVTRAGEEFVHELFVGVGGLVGEELVQLEGRRRQAREVEVNTACERGALGGRGGLELGGGDLLEDEGVDGVGRVISS